MGLVLGPAGDERRNLRDVVLSPEHAFRDAPNFGAVSSFFRSGSRSPCAAT
jgi:hypothetical protein